MKKIIFFFFCFFGLFSFDIYSQKISLSPIQGQMVCGFQVPGFARQTFALVVPETIGSSEGMILNFPEADIKWVGPDDNGIVSHSWKSANKIEYSIRLVPFNDYIDMVMTIKNLSNYDWTNVFSFNCLNPVNSDQFKDWGLERTFISKNGKPFKLDSTNRVNNGQMNTVQFYLHENYHNVSPFVTGFSATNPDKTDDSYMVTISNDGTSYMAATSPDALFLFNNLDRCCIHSATNFGNMPIGTEKTVISRFYISRGTLSDFINRYNTEIKSRSKPNLAMCWAKPWELADTSQWQQVYNKLDIMKFYIGDINNRIDKTKAKKFLSYLIQNNIQIAVEIGGLLDWYADKGDQAAELSFQHEFVQLKLLIDLLDEIEPGKSIDILDMDGPIRRMLYPNNRKENYHTIESAVKELFEVVKFWHDSVPDIKINLLTNFPNWAWNVTPAYFQLFGSKDGYGRYEDVLNAVYAESKRTGLRFDGLTIDNPYDYAIGAAQSNQPDIITGIDWMERIAELSEMAGNMGMKINMIFNTNGGRTAQGYSEQTLLLIDFYHQKVGTPNGYWIQSWYELPGQWLPESEPYTMTNLTLEVAKKIEKIQKSFSLLEPDDGKVYHGVQTMTFESSEDPLAGYLGVINDSTIQPAVRGIFFSIPGTRGPDKSLKELSNFFISSDSIGFIPELSLFLVSDIATDSIIAESDQYDWILDSIITLSKKYGKRMFLRIGGEFNGAGPGWNGGGYHPYIYPVMFRKIVDKFKSRGFRDSVAVNWCYEPDAPNDFDSVDARGSRWYPGDEYVDWFGLDVFDAEHFDQSLSNYDNRGITKKGKSERFLQMARMKGKPVFLSETSAKGINISSDEQDSFNDWNKWFAKFFEFIKAHIEIKGFAYINANWPTQAYPNWGDARIQNSPYIVNQYIQELKKTKYIHLPYKSTQSDTLPLTELGLNKWKGYEGGLYPGGSNSRPNFHNNKGIRIAQNILPLNSNGITDNISGKIVLLSIGMSNTTQEFSKFKQIADTLSLKNPKLVIVDGAQGGAAASVISNPDAGFWNVVGQRLQSAGVSENQVQIVWLKEANAGPTQPFPEHAQLLKSDLKAIVKILKQKYPNIKLTFISSRTYGGYATTQLNPEPYAYESGFSVKWLIEEQINGDTAVSFEEPNPKAPWLSWGPYLWARGTIPRSDGLQWFPEDFGIDGTHPSESGRLKVANLLLDFMSRDSACSPWFIASPTSIDVVKTLQHKIMINPNPASDIIYLTSSCHKFASGLTIYNSLGKSVLYLSSDSFLFSDCIVKVDISYLTAGLYFIKVGNQVETFVKE